LARARQYQCSLLGRVPFGRSLLAQILEVYGLRLRARRPGRSPDEIALRGTFDTFFPGAQWVGDGKTVTVVIGQESLHVTLELITDTKSGTFVGLSVHDSEDSTAIVEAFGNGVSATGAPPLALLLDNRPSNHTPEVDAVLQGALRIRATPERPQNKAHAEGAFGLFAQTVPPLVLDTALDQSSLVRQLVLLVATTWARAVPLLIGSVKTNIGHLEAAAEIAGLIKTTLALKHRTIPPSLHFESPNPHIPFEALRLKVPTSSEPWPERDGRRLSGVSSFGFGGTNCHIVLADAQPEHAHLLPLAATDRRTPSARCPGQGPLPRSLSTHLDPGALRRRGRSCERRSAEDRRHGAHARGARRTPRRSPSGSPGPGRYRRRCPREGFGSRLRVWWTGIAMAPHGRGRAE
jgi:hypothetical protein